MSRIKPQNSSYPAHFAAIIPNLGDYPAFSAGYDEIPGIIRQVCRLIIVARNICSDFALKATIFLAFSSGSCVNVKNFIPIENQR
ncbi:MAG: hypothetical protein H6667_16075 [Ardenticatenaceae bacterium]|nr:hypothetical protein [Ardenticatenaceae bacterium]MCB9443649.1 hypothetical protein [Ardenticatenaceae bacterium]